MKDSNKDNKKLLLIDDDPNLILLVKDYLEFRGYEVMAAGNGREALEILNLHLPDMIICDLIMPEMGGVEVLEALAAEDLSTRTIVLTGADLDVEERVVQKFDQPGMSLVRAADPDELGGHRTSRVVGRIQVFDKSGSAIRVVQARQ